MHWQDTMILLLVQSGLQRIHWSMYGSSTCESENVLIIFSKAVLWHQCSCSGNGVMNDTFIMSFIHNAKLWPFVVHNRLKRSQVCSRNNILLTKRSFIHNAKLWPLSFTMLFIMLNCDLLSFIITSKGHNFELWTTFWMTKMGRNIMNDIVNDKKGQNIVNDKQLCS